MGGEENQECHADRKAFGNIRSPTSLLAQAALTQSIRCCYCCSHSCFLAVRNFLFLAVGYLRRNLDPSPEHVPWEGCCFPSLQSLECSAMFASSIHGFVKAPGGIRRAKKTPEHWAASPLCTGNYRGDSDRGITHGRMD